MGKIDQNRTKNILEEVWDERQRQIEMANAAACYAMKPSARNLPMSPYTGDSVRERIWPWDKQRWKRRELIKAAALIVAEIERMDRSGK